MYIIMHSYHLYIFHNYNFSLLLVIYNSIYIHFPCSIRLVINLVKNLQFECYGQQAEKGKLMISSLFSLFLSYSLGMLDCLVSSEPLLNYFKEK
jgi:hypothetical protein